MIRDQNEQSLYPPAVSPCFQGTEWTLEIIILFKACSPGMDLDGIRENKRINNGQALGFQRKIMLKRGRLNTLCHTLLKGTFQ